MSRFYILCAATLCTCSCLLDAVETSASEQASTHTERLPSQSPELQGTQLQGTQLQGTQLQGTQLQGMSMQGFQFAGATLGASALMNLRVEHGEVVAEQDQVTLRGASLIGAHLQAQLSHPDAIPPITAVVEYRITNIVEEDPHYDPTNTGSTFLYTLEQKVGDSDAWQPACPVDLDGRRVAIPVAATWDTHGDRVESSSLFTFGCTTGVIAKCYRWGYRPWLTSYGDLAAMHWACTRLARADYCGDGVSHTQDGTWINVWDDLAGPGPIQSHGAGRLHGMSFEAGWNTDGAACVGRTRWKSEMKRVTATCPDRRMSKKRAQKVCDDVEDALDNGLVVLLFNESFNDPNHPHL
jgi:ADYC domain